MELYTGFDSKYIFSLNYANPGVINVPVCPALISLSNPKKLPFSKHWVLRT
jgi:hypothetical protein